MFLSRTVLTPASMMQDTRITNPILPCQTQKQFGYQVASGEIQKIQ